MSTVTSLLFCPIDHRRVLRRFVLAAALILIAASSFAARQGGGVPVQLPLFPTNNWWNTDVSNAPLDPSSASFITFIGPTRALHPDFGGDAGNGDTYGFPFLIVDSTQPKLAVTFDYADESDGVDHNTGLPFPFYPIPPEAITNFGWVEGGQPGNVNQRADADRHILIIDKTNNDLYELYNVWFDGSGWVGGSGAFFAMDTNKRRPEGWTSADAAGLAILPGLVRYDEVFGPGEIHHAFRFTVRATNGHVYPASHTAGSTSGALPMGARLRLKAATNISGFAPEIQKIFRAFKKYGLIVADNGSDMYISGTYDTRWNNDVLNPAFAALHASDFEVVQRGWQPSVSLQIAVNRSVPKGIGFNMTVTATDPNYNVATGYRGTVHFTSTDVPATLPADYTFTAADNGVHAFSGIILPTAGEQTITITDIANATITATRRVSVGPAVPVGVIATATSATSVGVSWDAAPGATLYDVQRRSSPAGYSTVATVSGTSHPDPVAADGVYLYRVVAKAGADSSAPSAADVATTFVFADDPIVRDVTPIKAQHVTQLRTAVNAMRAIVPLGAAGFTDPTLDSTVFVKAVHFQELQDALDEARIALLLPPNSYHDAFYDAGVTFIKADNIREIRSGLK